MISVRNLKKSYGEQILLDQVSFSLSAGERLGLVGRNGEGKTTLFRLLTGSEEYDSGEILFPKGYRLGHLDQHIRFTCATLFEEGCRGLPDEKREEESWKVKKVLFGLGFSEEDLEQRPQLFSGGYQMRLQLAKVLVSEPNLLLLDEPTNFLDILSIRWLGRFLHNWDKELLLITHDTFFMDSVTTHIMGINRKQLKKVKGKSDDYYRQIALEEEHYEKNRLQDDKKTKELELFINRFRAKAGKAKQVQSRIKGLEKMEKREKLADLADLAFSFPSAPFPAKTLLQCRQITFSYKEDSPLLIPPFNFTFDHKDRVAIIGKNGKGKTTLLKLLAGVLNPLKGEILLHDKVSKGYFEQANSVNLDGQKTIEEEILSDHPEGSRKKARDICGAMLFSGDRALKKIEVLSGGEKCRVLLGKLLARPSNLLMLDEPTHHLDMASCEALIEAIEAFEGAVILVTHSEEFLHRVANRLIVFQKGGIELFEGSYSEFLESRGWEDEQEERPSSLKGKGEDQLSRKEKKQARARFIGRRSKTLNPLKKQIALLEEEIMELEEAVEETNNALVQASQQGDAPAITRLSTTLHQKQKRIDDLFSQLEEESEKLETLSARFDEEENSL